VYFVLTATHYCHTDSRRPGKTITMVLVQSYPTKYDSDPGPGYPPKKSDKWRDELVRDPPEVGNRQHAIGWTVGLAEDEIDWQDKTFISWKKVFSIKTHWKRKLYWEKWIQWGLWRETYIAPYGCDKAKRGQIGIFQ
jgi:hypothetical protein